MKNNKVLRVIECILQVITIISSIVAIVSMIKNYKYKIKLKEKAEVYLDEELGEFQDVKRKISVFSPEVSCNERQIKKLLMVTMTGIVSLITIGILKKD